MKLIGGLILLICLLLQTFSKWVLLVDFQLNQDYIAQNLCENKERPQLKCGGKCQLLKKLAEDEEKNNSTGTERSLLKAAFNALLFVPAQHHYFISGTEVTPATFYDSYRIKKYTSPINAIFHPPAYHATFLS